MSFLYDQFGHRKYLTQEERAAFLNAAAKSHPEVYTFSATLAYTGARISEVLALSPDRVDLIGKVIIIESLKKRCRGIYRVIPVPSELLEKLDEIHAVKEAQRSKSKSHLRIWPWCRTTAWKNVKATMNETGIVGARACPKGLRHSFGVNALNKGVPLNMVAKWLGHSRLSTTSIYADAVGDEERKIAERLWNSF